LLSVLDIVEGNDFRITRSGKEFAGGREGDGAHGFYEALK